jgi:hypothetical protein
MGNAASQYDESTFAYEPQDPVNCYPGDMHVTWTTAPPQVRDHMKQHVRAHLPADLIITDQISIPDYLCYIRKGKKNQSVSYKHPIREVLQEMGVARPYILHSNGRYWIVSFVQMPLA